MLKLFTVSVKSLIDDPLPVWYRKIKNVSRTDPLFTKIVQLLKKTDSYPFPSTNPYGAFLFLQVV